MVEWLNNELNDYVKNQNHINGFTITELIVVIIILALFYFGFIKGTEIISHWKGLSTGRWSQIVRVAAGLVSGSLLVSIFIFSCIGIGTFSDKKNKN
jgi:prepilin-type N-terminal cleavage/methylation domain-containing protein